MKPQADINALLPTAFVARIRRFSGIRLVSVVTPGAGLILGCVAVTARRRWVLPPDERLAVPYREWLAAAESELFEPDDRTDAALNVLLAVSVLLAVGSVGYAVAVPPQGEQFSKFYLLTETPEGSSSRTAIRRRWPSTRPPS